MNAILTLALKDLRLLSRDFMAAFFIFVFPLVYALFFGSIFGGGGPTGRIGVAIVDQDNTDNSRAFAAALAKSPSLEVQSVPLDAARESVRAGRRAAYVGIPAGFGESLSFFGGRTLTLEVGLDPSRKAEEGFLQGILMENAYQLMSQSFTNPEAMRKQAQRSLADVEAADMPASQKQLLKMLLGAVDTFAQGAPQSFGEDGKGRIPVVQPVNVKIVAVTHTELKPGSSFEYTFPSAMLWGVLGCVAGFATSLVQERTMGTFQRLRAAPLQAWQVLAGKATACFSVCVGTLVLLLLVAHLIFGVRIENAPLLALAVVCTSICFVGIMMLFATLGKSEQAVAGAGWAANTIMAMIGGGMIPLFVMPGWMQTLSSFSPVKWGILSLEGAIWRGSSFTQMLLPCGILLAIGVAGYAAGVAILSRAKM